MHAVTQLNTPTRSAPDTRVVLVGRTGLDAVLRLDPAMELVRVASPLEAVAAIATQERQGANGRTVVILGADAVVALADARGEAMQEFLSTVRECEARPRILVVGTGSLKQPHPLIDGIIVGDSPAQKLREVIRGDSPPAKAGDAGPAREAGKPVTPAAATPVAPQVPQPAKASAPAARASATAGEAARGEGLADAALAQALARGQDVMAPAMALVRERMGDAGAVFIAPDEPVGAGEVEVSVEGRVFGRLRAKNSTEAVKHARWLAAWLHLRDQHAQLREAAFTDSLTGAWNRRYYDKYMETVLERARGERRFVTVLLFDIDNFKSYNDQHGHEAGDEILKETVKLLTSVIRPSDRVCRIGGDEFAVVFHDPEGPRQEGSRHPQSVTEIAARFQKQITEHRFPKLLDTTPGTLTISGGLATFPWDGQTSAELLAHADKLALASKRAGKNAITMGPGAVGG